MKKMFFALAALVLAFTGCSQEDEAIQTNEQKAVKVVVNMDKPGFGEDTRAARTGWVDGDEVICTMGGPGIGIHLTYDADSDSWTTKMLRISGTNYVDADFDEVMASFLENPEDAEGPVKAAYFSSGIYSLAFVEPPFLAMVITTNAARISMGECVMTCENGSYGVEGNEEDGYVLTLNITMKPQVAQYTIRNLNLADAWYICMEDESPINMYAGGDITPEGVVLGLIEGPYYAYPHQNGNDISIFAAPWQSNEDIPIDLWESLSPELQDDDEFYCTETSYAFRVENDENWFERTIGYKEVKNGDAVIMDGPYTPGAASKWGVE